MGISPEITRRFFAILKRTVRCRRRFLASIRKTFIMSSRLVAQGIDYE